MFEHFKPKHFGSECARLFRGGWGIRVGCIQSIDTVPLSRLWHRTGTILLIQPTDKESTKDSEIRGKLARRARHVGHVASIYFQAAKKERWVGCMNCNDVVPCHRSCIPLTYTLYTPPLSTPTPFDIVRDLKWESRTISKGVWVGVVNSSGRVKNSSQLQ